MRLLDWILLIIGVVSFLSFIGQIGRRISFLDLLILAGVLYWFGVHKGWFERLQISTPSQDTPPVTPQTATTNEPTAQASTRKTETFEITVPHSTEWRPSVAASFMKALYDKIDVSGCYLSIRATNENISWELNANFTQDTLESFVNQFYPGAQVKPKLYQDRVYPYYRRYTVLSMDANEFFDLYTPITDHPRFDPLQLIAQTMNQLQAEEVVSFWLVVEKPKPIDDEGITEFLTMSAYDAGYRTSRNSPATRNWEEALGSLAVSIPLQIWDIQKLKKQRVDRFDERKTREYLSKLKQKISFVAIFLYIDTPDKNRLDFLTSVTGAVKGLTTHSEARLGDGVTKDALVKDEEEEWQFDPFEFLREWLKTHNAKPKKEKDEIKPKDIYFHPMTADELANLWHLPHSGFEGLKINWSASAPMQVVVSSREGEIPIGVLPNNKSSVAINRLDRKYHAYITGQTGMGKSTLIHNLVHLDIMNGQGVGVIDPHGALIKDILTTSITTDRLDDVVYLRFADAQYPIPLNPFRTPPSADEISVFNTVLWMMESIYKKTWSETQMETVIRNILQVVLTDPEATPLDIQEMVSNAHFRRRIIKTCEDRLSLSSKRFWETFEDSSPSAQKNQTKSVLNRLSAFLGSRHIELMTCHPHTLDFRKLISEKKIVLVDLSGKEVVSEVGTLGAIFFAQFFLASLSLGETPGNETPRFYLYVDETQRFITTAIPDMFSEARKFGLSLTLANQYIGQLDEDTREGIVNNVGTKFSFECSPDEAKMTAKLFEPHVTKEEMSRLGVGRAAVRTRWQGQTLDGFIVQTYDAPKPAGNEFELETIIERSRQNLELIPKKEVENWLNKRYSSDLFKGKSNEPDLKDIGDIE